MKVYWAGEATRRLRELTAYIAKDSPEAAKKVAATLLERSRRLTELPLLGRRCWVAVCPSIPTACFARFWSGHIA